MHNLFQVKKKKGWSIINAYDSFKKLSALEIREKIIPYHYRPFDKKFIIYDENLIWSRSYPTMQHMLHDNIGLCFIRQFSGEGQYSHVFVSREIVDNRTFFSSKGVIQQAPLYLYKTESKPKKSQTMMLFEPATQYDSTGRMPNISQDIIEKLERAYKKKFTSKDLTPEDILHYSYAVLYSNIYRKKYVEFLKIDFPRIPFTIDYKLFIRVVTLGKSLAELHLEPTKIKTIVVQFSGTGESVIEKPIFSEKEKCVYINGTKYFKGISKEMWEYNIGGYQVLKRYLDWRKGEKLDSFQYYCQVASVIQQTTKIQREIDEVFEKIESKVVELKK